ncbi:unnamed protein product [Prorocentrum cordatum]|uniref:Uncharacterized protein n=1 Tax=Prorocentrum cordatum TaxID=2364126 RepID=A0ABN9QW43_9DINO|nr:unnamed protein product [Polarella glacialis]
MACLAPPWPSQRRAAAAGGTSERHTALARMRQRRCGRDPEPEEAPRSSRAPPRARDVAPEMEEAPRSARAPPRVRDRAGDYGPTDLDAPAPRLGTAASARSGASPDPEDPMLPPRPTMPSMPQPPGSARGQARGEPAPSSRPGTGSAAPWDPAWVPDSPAGAAATQSLRKSSQGTGGLPRLRAAAARRLSWVLHSFRNEQPPANHCKLKCGVSVIVCSCELRTQQMVRASLRGGLAVSVSTGASCVAWLTRLTTPIASVSPLGEPAGVAGTGRSTAPAAASLSFLLRVCSAICSGVNGAPTGVELAVELPSVTDVSGAGMWGSSISMW